MSEAQALPQVRVYRRRRTTRFLSGLMFPVFIVLNRPAFRRLAELAYDFALRWNGFAIGFQGKHHLTHPEEKFLESYLPSITDGVLLDVGANEGHYTRYLKELRPDLPVFAFEPHPRTFATLRRQASLPGVELAQLALSDTSGTMTLHDFADNDGSTQASLGGAAVELFDSRTVTHDVQVGTLDDYAAAQGIGRIALLKIDTEGFDIHVLRGARGLLAAGRIDVIQFEFIPACIALRVTMRDFFEVLKGFRLHRLCVNGDLLPLERYDVKRCEVYVIQNLIALAPGVSIGRTG